MYQKQTDKLKSFYTHHWVFFDKKGQIIEKCPCTIKEKNSSAESYKNEICADSFEKVKNTLEKGMQVGFS